VMAGHRPFFRSQRTAFAVGIAGFGLAWWALYDAFEARGQDTPRPLRPFTWW
jgi:hypothetical protein